MWCANDRQLRLIGAYNEVSRLMIGGFPEVVSRAKLYRRNNKRNIDGTEASNNQCQANKDAFDLRTRVTSNLNKLQDEIKTNNYKSEVKIVKLGGRQYFARCKDIHYDSKSHTLCVGGREVDFNFHPATNRTQKGKPHPQLTEVIMKKIKAPIIKPSTPEEDKNNKRRDIIEVTFDNKKQVCIIYAKRDSPSPFLKAIHRVAISSNNHKELEELLNKMPSSKFSIDDSAGGRYLKHGFGWQACVCIPKRPFVMDTLDTTVAAVGYGIVNIIGQILHTTAAAILNYFPLVYHSNQEHKINPLLACPPLQNDRVNWFSNQYAIRQVGLGIGKTRPVVSRAQHHNGPSIEKQISESCVALHADSGDVSCMHPLVYIPQGGSKGLGGVVKSSDLLVCEHATGGKSIQIVTNEPDVVCIVILNSRECLHGMIKQDDWSSDNDPSAYITRIIPYITNGVDNWMKKNPDGTPIDKFGNYFNRNK